MKISPLRASFAAIAAATALLAGCASTPAADGTQVADNSAAADAKCNEDRPTTGSSISHHDCREHSNVVTVDPSVMRNANRNTAAPVK